MFKCIFAIIIKIYTIQFFLLFNNIEFMNSIIYFFVRIYLSRLNFILCWNLNALNKTLLHHLRGTLLSTGHEIYMHVTPSNQMNMFSYKMHMKIIPMQYKHDTLRVSIYVILYNWLSYKRYMLRVIIYIIFYFYFFKYGWI